MESAGGSSASTGSTSAMKPTKPTSTVLPDAPELRPKPARGRIPSPTRLPVGSVRRSQSVRQASGASAGPGPPPAARGGHARQASTSAIGSVPAKPALGRSTSGNADRGSRRPNSAAQSRLTNPSRKDAEAERPTHARRASRSGPDEPKPASHSQGLKKAGPRNLPPPRPPTDEGQAAAGNARAASASSSARPAFSALQREYPIRKSGAAAAGQAQGRAAAAAPPNPELLESTLELAQLHTIHSRAAQTQKDWTESARLAHSKRFQELAELQRNLDRREQADLVQKNAQAIIGWSGKGSSDTLSRRIKVVSKALDEFWQLSSPGGRYAATVEAFEHWHDEISELRSGGAPLRDGATNGAEVLGGLGDGWKAEVESLQDRLLQTAQEVLSLGEIDPDADLARCIALLSEMMQNMLEELESLCFIEQSVVLQEQYWTQASIDQLSHGLHKTRLPG